MEMIKNYNLNEWFMKDQLILPKFHGIHVKNSKTFILADATFWNFPELNIYAKYRTDRKNYFIPAKNWIPGTSWIYESFSYFGSAAKSVGTYSLKIIEWIPITSWNYSQIVTPVAYIWNSSVYVGSYLFGWFPTNSYVEFGKQFNNITSALSALNIHKWYSPVTNWDYSEILKGIGRFGNIICKYGYGLPENSVYYFQSITQAGYIWKSVSSFRWDNKSLKDENWFAIKSWNITKIFMNLDFTKLSVFKLDVKSYEFRNWFLNRSLTELSLLMAIRYMEVRVALGLNLKKDSIDNRFIWGSTINTRLYLELEMLRYKRLLEIDIKSRSYLNKLSNAGWSYMQTAKRYWKYTKSFASWSSGNKEFDEKKEQGFHNISEDDIKFTKKRNVG